ncbi:MAG: hypothetical protein ACTSV2_17875, partial [Candidatus Thorarchaeota archaeon]
MQYIAIRTVRRMVVGSRFFVIPTKKEVPTVGATFICLIRSSFDFLIYHSFNGFLSIQLSATNLCQSLTTHLVLTSFEIARQDHYNKRVCKRKKKQKGGSCDPADLILVETYTPNLDLPMKTPITIPPAAAPIRPMMTKIVSTPGNMSINTNDTGASPVPVKIIAMSMVFV